MFMPDNSVLFATTNLPVNHLTVSLWMLFGILANLVLCREKLMNRAMRSPNAMAEQMIDKLERRYNHPEYGGDMMQKEGTSAILFLLILAFVAGSFVNLLFFMMPYAWIFGLLILASSLNLRTTLEQIDHLKAALGRSTYEARATLSLISGRDSQEMDKSAITRATIEYIAKSSATGLIAPLFYFAVGGFVGLFIYKMAFLASQMLDTRVDLSSHFGKTANRLHSILLWPASLITGLIISLIMLFLPAFKGGRALKTMLAEARHYFQPAAGWPVAALAGGLGLQLGGPLYFDNHQEDHAWVGTGSPIADQSHLKKARQLFIILTGLSVFIVYGVAAIAMPLPMDQWNTFLFSLFQAF